MSARFPRASAELADCAAHGRGSRAELFVVEGDSASLAVARLRDAAFQAVLPMQGKPMNAMRAPERRVAAHGFYAALTDALGAGRGDAFALGRARFERVLLLTDPDADGIHCAVLVLGFLQRWMRPLLDAGCVELVLPPWGEVVGAAGEAPRLAWSDRELRELSAAAHRSGRRGVAARRYRGLAGIDAALLARSCIEPASRRTTRITTADATTMVAAFAAGPPA